jgi:Flp pilus assembly protein TadG
MSSSKKNKEAGAVLVETAFVAPVILLMIMFGLDLFIFSQSQSVVTQIARESALYLATVPGNLSSQTPYVNILQGNAQDVDEWAQLCNANYNLSDCAHLNAQIRVRRMLDSSSVFLNVAGAQVTTAYSESSGDKFVTVTLNVPVNTYFKVLSSSASRTVQLRRVNT